MRIIVTGLTAGHGGRPLRGVQRLNPPEYIVRALRDAGHEVTWSGFKLETPRPEADLLWWMASPAKSLTATNYGLGALATLGAWHGPFVVQHDDWNLRATFGGARSFLNDPDRQLFKLLGKGPERYPLYRNESPEVIRAHRHEIVRGLERMLSHHEPVTYVALAFGWGNLEMLRSHFPKGAGQITSVDLSPAVYPIIADQTPLPKERRWVSAMLAAHDTWLANVRRETTWQLEVLSSPARGGDRQTDEQGVYEAYRTAWGVLAPPYGHAGSGWFRARYVYSAAARSVLLAQNGEADALGPAYQLTREQVEEMTDAQLRDVAEAQADALRLWMPTWDELVAQVDEIAKQAVG